jgi:hypothetical protein
MSEEAVEAPVATVDALRTEAAAWAVANPPSRIVATAVLGILTFIGWLIGRAYLAVAGAIRFSALAITYGYRKGAKVPTEPRKRKNIGS